MRMAQLTDKRLEKLHQIQEQLSVRNGDLYIWGAAKTAEKITAFITENSTLSAAAYVVDDLYFKEGTFLGRPLIKASEFFKKVTEKDHVILGFMQYDRVRELEKELQSYVSFSFFPIPLSPYADGVCLDRAFYEKHKERFESTRGILSDEISGQTFDSFVNAHMTGNTEQLDSLYAKGQYFNELTSVCRPGCFVDCGAYIGDTIQAAIDFLGSRVERIIAFEPDPENIKKLKQYINIEENKIRIKILQKGSYDKPTVLKFSSSSDMNSAISENGNLTIETDTIDHAAEDMGEISFIKMDIEGSELKSILGAADTIRKYHPILAVCAYHKPEDLLELPEAIRKITDDSGYKYYLRYHGPGLLELVLYVIPE